MSGTRPKRIQRRRSKGWSAPKRAVYVGRGSRYGNLYKIGDPHPDKPGNPPMDRGDVVALYWLRWSQASEEGLAQLRLELGDRDLMCWCREDQACHADVLLELANGRVR